MSEVLPLSLQFLSPVFAAARQIQSQLPLLAFKCRVYGTALAMELGDKQDPVFVNFLKVRVNDLAREKEGLEPMNENEICNKLETVATSIILHTADGGKKLDKARTVSRLELATVLLKTRIHLYGDSDELQEHLAQAQTLLAKYHQMTSDNLSVSTTRSGGDSPSPPDSTPTNAPNGKNGGLNVDRFASAPSVTRNTPPANISISSEKKNGSTTSSPMASSAGSKYNGTSPSSARYGNNNIDFSMFNSSGAHRTKHAVESSDSVASSTATPSFAVNERAEASEMSKRKEETNPNNSDGIAINGNSNLRRFNSSSVIIHRPINGNGIASNNNNNGNTSSNDDMWIDKEKARTRLSGNFSSPAGREFLDEEQPSKQPNQDSVIAQSQISPSLNRKPRQEPAHQAHPKPPAQQSREDILAQENADLAERESKLLKELANEKIKHQEETISQMERIRELESMVAALEEELKQKDELQEQLNTTWQQEKEDLVLMLNRAGQKNSQNLRKNALRCDEKDPSILKNGHMMIYTERQLAAPLEAVVVDAEWYTSKKEVKPAVAKICRISHISDESIKQLFELDHPHVVQYLDHVRYITELGSFHILLSERANLSLGNENGRQYLQDSSWTTCVNLVRDALSGLDYLHQNFCLHGSIKPSNIIVFVEINGRENAKLCDPIIGVGSTFRIKHPHEQDRSSPCVQVKGAVGRGWAAPEVFKNGKIEQAASDVFSFGLVAYFILVGGVPPEVFDAPVDERGLDLSIFIAKKNWSGADLLDRMCRWEFNDRPTALRALLHPFFWTSTQHMEFLALVGHVQRNPDDKQISEEMVSFQSELELECDEYLGGTYETGHRWSASYERYDSMWGAIVSNPCTIEEDNNFALTGCHRGVALLKWIRDVWTKRKELVRNKMFMDEQNLAKSILEPIPWLTVAVFQLVARSGLSHLQSLLPYYDGNSLPASGEVEGSETSSNGGAPARSLANAALASQSFVRAVLPKSKWVPDDNEKHCILCKKEFGPLRRRHHCRLCGQLFCKECTHKSLMLKDEMGRIREERVCNVCFDTGMRQARGSVISM